MMQWTVAGLRPALIDRARRENRRSLHCCNKKSANSLVAKYPHPIKATPLYYQTHFVNIDNYFSKRDWHNLQFIPQIFMELYISIYDIVDTVKHFEKAWGFKSPLPHWIAYADSSSVTSFLEEPLLVNRCLNCSSAFVVSLATLALSQCFSRYLNSQ